MAYENLLMERPVEGVSLITFNRPQARNALHIAMQAELDDALRQHEQDPSVRAIVLTGAGDKAFCAGYDLHEMKAYGADDLVLTQLRREPWIWYTANYPKPLIGAINGAAHGAGAVIATALDIRIGCANTDFRYTAVAYGGANNTWQLPPIVGFAKAKEFLMTGRRIGPEEALQAGLLNHLVAPESLLDKAIEIGAQIAANPPEGVQWHKALIHAHLGRSYEEAYRAENAIMMNELRPRPPGEMFSKFLAKHPKA